MRISNNENYNLVRLRMSVLLYGQANLDNALSKFEHKDDVNIEYKSFLDA